VYITLKQARANLTQQLLNQMPSKWKFYFQLLFPFPETSHHHHQHESRSNTHLQNKNVQSLANPGLQYTNETAKEEMAVSPSKKPTRNQDAGTYASSSFYPESGGLQTNNGDGQSAEPLNTTPMGIMLAPQWQASGVNRGRGKSRVSVGSRGVNGKGADSWMRMQRGAQAVNMPGMTGTPLSGQVKDKGSSDTASGTGGHPTVGTQFTASSNPFPSPSSSSVPAPVAITSAEHGGAGVSSAPTAMQADRLYPPEFYSMPLPTKDNDLHKQFSNSGAALGAHITSGTGTGINRYDNYYEQNMQTNSRLHKSQYATAVLKNSTYPKLLARQSLMHQQMIAQQHLQQQQQRLQEQLQHQYAFSSQYSNMSQQSPPQSQPYQPRKDNPQADPQFNSRMLNQAKPTHHAKQRFAQPMFVHQSFAPYNQARSASSSYQQYQAQQKPSVGAGFTGTSADHSRSQEEREQFESLEANSQKRQQLHRRLAEQTYSDPERSSHPPNYGMDGALGSTNNSSSSSSGGGGGGGGGGNSSIDNNNSSDNANNMDNTKPVRLWEELFVPGLSLPQHAHDQLQYRPSQQFSTETQHDTYENASSSSHNDDDRLKQRSVPGQHSPQVNLPTSSPQIRTRLSPLPPPPSSNDGYKAHPPPDSQTDPAATKD
jgi:hypothetical protein